MTEEHDKSENDVIYQIDIPIPQGAFVTHSVTAMAMMNDKGEIELVVATRGQNTMTNYVGLLTWATNDILKWQ